ncbi:MAG: hypothetical protein MUP98_09075 [Candidatus Aminicenantes bacterium]|nr:hypothetical protein [Candidatus Aminicenantes bacterium]
MISIPGLFGFPPPEKRDSVRFYVAKKLPYNLRISITVILLIVGFCLQLVFLDPVYGIPFLILGIILVFVKGYDSRKSLKTFNLDPSWKTVPIEKIQEIERLRKKSRRWDRDALDVSNPLGFFGLLLFSSMAIALAIGLGILAKDTRISSILVLDTIILVVPIWLSGMKLILKQPNLAVRVNLILKLHNVFQNLKKEELFKPALMLTKDENNKAVPVDARFSIRFPHSPDGFYGLQAQINLNVVQGSSYPYFYCVLAAKPGFRLASFRDKIDCPPQIICEAQKDERAEVLVIRQKTTKNSGYHTNDSCCAEILAAALEGGRKIIDSIQKTQLVNNPS